MTQLNKPMESVVADGSFLNNGTPAIAANLVLIADSTADRAAKLPVTATPATTFRGVTKRSVASKVVGPCVVHLGDVAVCTAHGAITRGDRVYAEYASGFEGQVKTYTNFSTNGLQMLVGIALGTAADQELVEVMICPQLTSVETASQAAAAQVCYRAVCTSIAAYTTALGVITAAANAAIGAQDGVTLVANDYVYLPGSVAVAAGGAACDAGLYVVTNPGAAGAKYVLTRCSWFADGSLIPRDYEFKVGSEGTAFKGCVFKSFVTNAIKVVGTDDPTFWPRAMHFRITLSSGTYTIGAGGGSEPLFLRSATESHIHHDQVTPGGTMTLTVGFSAPSANRTPGGVAVAACTINAIKADKSTDTACSSTLDVTVSNWS